MSTLQGQIDDLTTIRGIGRSRQKWFNQVFAVHTYQQLATLSADTVEAALKAAGKLSSRAEIENWLTQARELAAQPRPELQPNETVYNEGDASTGEAASAKTAADGEAWTPLASFVVEFQWLANAPAATARRTAVHHIEADQGAFWPGVALDQVHAWLAAHVTVPEPLAAMVFAPETTQPPAAVVARSATFYATEVRILQPPHHRTMLDVTQAVTSRAIHNVSHEKPITIEVVMAVSGAASAAGSGLQYTARCQVHDLTRGRRPYWIDMQEGDVAQNGPADGCRSHRTELQLEPGTYELSVLLSGQQVSGPYYFKLPKLNVL